MKASYDFNCVGTLTVWERHVEGDLPTVMSELNTLFDDCYMRDHNHRYGQFHGRHMWAPIYADTNKPVDVLKQVRKAFFTTTDNETFVLRHGEWSYMPKHEDRMCRADGRMATAFQKQARKK